MAHRVSDEACVGPIPQGLQIDHHRSGLICRRCGMEMERKQMTEPVYQNHLLAWACRQCGRWMA